MTDIRDITEDYPYNSACLTEGDLAVVKHGDLGHLCGYCAFKDDEIPAEWRGNYDAPGLQYLNIHGGITYAKHKNGYTVFGLDCAHAGDEHRPELSDPQYVLDLARQMRAQIAIFSYRYQEWIDGDHISRTNLINEIRAEADIQTELGLGAMIDLLTGASEFGDDND